MIWRSPGLLRTATRNFLSVAAVYRNLPGSMFGHYATQMLADFKFDAGFFGAASINEDFEVMTPTIDKMWLKRETPRQCRKSYLAADRSKFGRQAMTRINTLGDYSAVITDKEFAEADLERLEHMNAVIIEAK